jgi:hypothetical protein
MKNEVKARAAPREATMIKKSIQMVGTFPDEVAVLIAVRMRRYSVGLYPSAINSCPNGALDMFPEYRLS